MKRFLGAKEPTQVVREYDDRFLIDDFNLEFVVIDSVKAEPLTENDTATIVSVSFVAKDYIDLRSE